MLEAGVFGGHYFKGDISEYPKSWFKKAKINDTEFDINLNCFKIKSGLTMGEWIKNGCKTHWKIQNKTKWTKEQLSPLLQYNFIEIKIYIFVIFHTQKSNSLDDMYIIFE